MQSILEILHIWDITMRVSYINTPVYIRYIQHSRRGQMNLGNTFSAVIIFTKCIPHLIRAFLFKNKIICNFWGLSRLNCTLKQLHSLCERVSISITRVCFPSLTAVSILSGLQVVSFRFNLSWVHTASAVGVFFSRKMNV